FSNQSLRRSSRGTIKKHSLYRDNDQKTVHSVLSCGRYRFLRCTYVVEYTGRRSSKSFPLLQRPTFLCQPTRCRCRCKQLLCRCRAGNISKRCKSNNGSSSPGDRPSYK